MASHSILNLALFRAAFPAFSNTASFPDALVNMQYANAGFYINQNDSIAGGLIGPIVDFVLQLLTCHLLQSGVIIANGQLTVVLTGGNIDGVSVSLLPPPVKAGWQFWLSTTAYGLQLWGLLVTQSVGGWSVSNAAYSESQGFRKAGGYF